MKRSTGFVLTVLFLAGCQTSYHRPVMVQKEEDIECPEWAVLADIDGKFFCIDRRVLEEGGSHDK